METILSLAGSNAVTATLLAAAAAIVARFCRRPAVRHALWLLVLLKLLTPPVVSLGLSWPWPPEVAPAPETASPRLAELPAEPIIEPGPSEATPAEPDVAVPVRLSLKDWAIPALMAVWICGSLAWWTIAGMRLARFQRLLREAPAAPEAVQDRARFLAGRLGLRRCPAVSFVAAPLSPLLWALGFSPRLLMPADLWQRLGPEQRDTLLAHELAHLCRGDHWVRRLEFVVLGLYWWHPVVWWARRRLQEAEEECCDARVVAALPDAASAYASALVETVAFLSQTRAASLVGVSGAGQVPLLKRRLAMILTDNPSPRSSRAAFWTVLGAGALLLPLTPGAAQTERTADDPQPASAGAPPQDAGRESKSSDNPHANLRALNDRMAKCAGCHDDGTLHLRDWLEKPVTWREAHDEVVRLMDEVRRRQAELREAERRFPAAIERDRAQQIENVQDEIELLKVQIQLKQAHLEAAKADAVAAEIAFKRMQQAGGAVPAGQLYKAEAEMAAQKAQVRIREAEVQEPLVKLKQAERRLARLQPRPPQKADAGSRAQQEKRLQELEKTIKQLTEEMRSIQRELQRRKPQDRPGNPGTP